MNQHDGAKISQVPAIDLLARAIERHAHKAGHHVTALPALLLHRRAAPTEPVHCIYDFGLAVTTQGAKQVMLGDKVFNYGPGESMRRRSICRSLHISPMPQRGNRIWD